MKLSQLIQALPFLEKRNYSEVEISGLSFNSEEVQEGNLFIAIVGNKLDGHDFVSRAIQKGAAAVVLEKNVPVPPHIPVFRVEDCRSCLSHLAAFWFENPSKKLKVIGVTGTNGKTTITCMLEHILQFAGLKAGRIGTIGFHYGGKYKKIQHTTPESTAIHEMILEMKSQRIEFAVMEVSSHAIDMHRVEDIIFDLAIFTNLTPEHLDYHKSMELYFESKKRLFYQILPKGKGLKRAILNADDPYGQKLIDLLQDTDVWTYSTRAQSKWDLYVQEWKSDLKGLSGTLSTPAGKSAFSSPLIGAFNLSNILASIGAALSFQIPLTTIIEAISKFNQVSGRLERIENKKNLHIFVDYAHTPDALKNVLQSLRELDPRKIVTVFGCGGDRDRAKRPIMGREAARFSDQVIVTSDNPRTEHPDKIIGEIIPGLEEGGMTRDREFWVEPDRRKAIQLGLNKTGAGDVLLIAGKGHEDYQILGTKKIHFDDREIVREALKKP